MTQEQAIKTVAYQLYLANGRQEGSSQQDWEQANNIVKSFWSSGQRCISTKARDGRTVIVTVSPGHSSY